MENVSRKRLTVDPRFIWFGLVGTVLAILSTQPFHSWLSFLSWRYIHILSASAYSGIVFISAGIETVALYRGDLTLIRGYHDMVRVFDQRIITVSVSALLVSALALLRTMGYEPSVLTPEPFWAWLALVIILSNGLFWIVLDVPNQRHLGRLFEEAESSELTPEMRRLLTRRMWVNMPSVLVLPILYYLMVFKPVL